MISAKSRCGCAHTSLQKEREVIPSICSHSGSNRVTSRDVCGASSTGAFFFFFHSVILPFYPDNHCSAVAPWPFFLFLPHSGDVGRPRLSSTTSHLRCRLEASNLTGSWLVRKYGRRRHCAFLPTKPPVQPPFCCRRFHSSSMQTSRARCSITCTPSLLN
jgi:hypothetical protein